MPYAELDASSSTFPYNRRRARRIRIDLSVHIYADRFHQAGKLQEISRTGAKLEMVGAVLVNQIVVLSRAGLELSARVVWTNGRTMGVEFRYPLPEKSFLRMRRASD